MTFRGWAIDVREQELAEKVMIFVNGKLWHAGPTWQDRPDVSRFFDNHRFLRSGFKYTAPRHVMEQIDDTEIRFFAVSSKDVATELYYFKGYQWLASQQD